MQLLEKLREGAATPIDRYARFGLVQRGLITESDPPRLTELGVARLDELRRAKAAQDGAEKTKGESDWSPA